VPIFTDPSSPLTPATNSQLLGALNAAVNVVIM
jgi:hypothetical protein